jgi:hypothetical protein
MSGLKGFRSVLFTLVLSTFAAGPAAAFTIYTEVGDAGDQTGSASLLPAVDGIDGALDAFGGDMVDLYRIYIASASTFSARTGPFMYGAALADPVLYLFDSAGMGVMMDDDGDIDGNAQSALGALPGGFSSGWYFIAVAFSGVTPFDASALSIFDAFGSLAVDSSAGALAGFSGDPLSPNYDLPATYHITFTGTVPEPGTFVLMLLGLAGVSVASRKSRRDSGAVS